MTVSDFRHLVSMCVKLIRFITRFAYGNLQTTILVGLVRICKMACLFTVLCGAPKVFT